MIDIKMTVVESGGETSETTIELSELCKMVRNTERIVIVTSIGMFDVSKEDMLSSLNSKRPCHRDYIERVEHWKYSNKSALKFHSKG